MSSEKKRKLINLLTICIKSGMAAKGFDAVCEALKGGKAFCVMTASDASGKTVKETAYMCKKYGADLIKTEITKEELGKHTGGKNTAVVAVIGSGFAKSFREIAGPAAEKAAKAEENSGSAGSGE